jgi:hypothetical protein
LGHEINLIARAEAALMAEGNTAVADMARRRQTAGVGDQVMCTRKSWEPEKSYRLLP